MSTLITLILVSEKGQLILESKGRKFVVGVDNLEMGCPFLLTKRRKRKWTSNKYN